MHDALQLLVNQGEVFSSSGIIYLQPDYITRLLKPLVDHRLTRSRFQQILGALPGDAETQARRAALLLPACELFTRTGELREELLAPMWQPLGLGGDDYGDVVVMLSASGVLFLAEHSTHGRRWVMPMRLPEARPAEAYSEWCEMMGAEMLEENEQLSVGYRLGRFAPPGIQERLIAACNRLGEYNAFWKRGAILDTPVGPSSLLLEMRTTMVPGNVTGETHASHELCIDVRGPKYVRAKMWLLLLRVQETAERLLEDFPGMNPDGCFYCPSCMSRRLAATADSPDATLVPTTWPLADAGAKRLTCEQCTDQGPLQLFMTKLNKEDDKNSKDLGLFVTPAPMIVTEAQGVEAGANPDGTPRRQSDDGTPRATDPDTPERPGTPGTPERPGLQRRNSKANMRRQSTINFGGSAVVASELVAGSSADFSPPKGGDDRKRSVTRVMGLDLGLGDGIRRLSEENMMASGRGSGTDSHRGEGSERGTAREHDSFRGSSGAAAAAGGGPAPAEEQSNRLTDMDAITSACGSDVIAKAKFAAKAVRFGRPIEAGVGLHKLLGLVSEDVLTDRMKQVATIENAIVEEIGAAGSDVKDPAGYTDADWLNYVKDAPAEERKMPTGMPDAVLDEGHQLMRLDDFVAQPIAQSAGLKRYHVLALRLYTTSFHHSINRPLHEGCSPNKPHPFPTFVAVLCEALKKLRAAAAEAEKAAANAAAKAAPAAPPPPGTEAAVQAVTQTASHLQERTLWRGVADLHTAHELKQRGGTELGFVSCSSNRAVAEEYTLRPPDDDLPLSLVLKVRADLTNGSDLSWCAVFPIEAECVYPPATYLEARSSWDEAVTLPNGEEIGIKVIEVVPRLTSFIG